MKAPLIIGADSMIGAALCKRLQAEGLDVKTTTRATLDLASDPAGWPELSADVSFICAAVSTLAGCEEQPAKARQVNVEGTLALAQRLHDKGSYVLFLSSNHVFDGTMPQRLASDSTCPINEYGRQKAQTERGLLGIGPHGVLRLTKVIAPGDKRLGAWRHALMDGETVTAFDDIFLSPSTLDNVLQAMVTMGKEHRPGISQLSGALDYSYFDLAQTLAGQLGIEPEKVLRGSGAEAGIPESFRPRYSSYAPGDFAALSPADASAIVAYAIGA